MGGTARTVTVDSALFTIIIQVRVGAERGEAFVRELTEVVGRTMMIRPGFRCSVF